MKVNWKGIAICAIGTSFAVLVAIHFRKSTEPEYQGRTLNSWLEDFASYGAEPNSPPANAIRNMGTNAVPILLNILTYEETPLQKKLRKTSEGLFLPNLFSSRDSMREVEAAYALNTMGPTAESAFPILTNLFYRRKHLTPVTICLAGAGDKGVSILLSALTNQNLMIRHSAADGLGYARSDLQIVIPALIQILQSNDHALMHHAAAMSLGLIHEEPELSVPALMESFNGTDDTQKGMVIVALKNFGSKAKAAVPLLIQATKDKDENVRELAKQAIQEIAPESLDKTKVIRVRR